MKKLGMNVLLIVLVVLAFGTVALAKDPKVVSTPDAPPALGPYSQAIKYGELLFISGQIARDPAGNLVPGDITTQTHQVMLNLKAILEEAKMDFDDVLMTTVYLKNLSDFGAFNAAYGSYFAGSDHPPARATLQAGIPGSVTVPVVVDSLVEVSMIAGK